MTEAKIGCFSHGFINIRFQQTKTLFSSEAIDACSRYERIKHLQIFSCGDSDYAIVTFVNPLHLPWLSQGQRLEQMNAPDRWILRTAEYQMEALDGNFHQESTHFIKANELFVERMPDLVDDALLHIFKYLKTDDLLVVARCSKNFKYLAHKAYTRSDNKLSIDSASFHNITELVQFGSVVQRLELNLKCDLSKAVQITQKVFRHVDRNKLKSLRILWDISIGERSGYTSFLESEIQVLPALEILQIDCSTNNFHGEPILFKNLGELCPKLKVVKLFKVSMSVSDGLNGARPSLHTLHVTNCSPSPQQWEWLFWAGKNLSEIVVNRTRNFDFDEIIKYAIKFNLQNIRKIVFKCDEDYSVNADLSSFSKLKYIHLGGSLICSLRTVDALSKASSITTIEIINTNWTGPLRDSKFLEILAKKMPQLKSFKIMGYTVPLRDMCEFKMMLPGCQVKRILSNSYPVPQYWFWDWSSRPT